MGYSDSVKNKNSTAPQSVKNWLKAIGSRGGKAGSREDKRKAANARWSKRSENLAVKLAAK